MPKMREAKLVALEVEDRNVDEFEALERDHGIDTADLRARHLDHDSLLEFWSSGFWHSFARRRRGANFRARPFSSLRGRVRHRRRP